MLEGMCVGGLFSPTQASPILTPFAYSSTRGVGNTHKSLKHSGELGIHSCGLSSLSASFRSSGKKKFHGCHPGPHRRGWRAGAASF